ncbi:MAG TPA: PTS IIA-like nitrogen-regulatory protein PtsN [Gammaproteobacteria bacterium]|nr:PTS IIA-like nitrogen-regulatory protein PtsN [Gammaproteobacteria bacterium]
MDLGDLITQDAVIPSLKAKSKKQALLELSDKASELIAIDSRQIFDVLLQRERLGSTGVGRGIAIPHGKLTPLTSIFSMFARLDSPIEFDSMDDEPVDLIFLLLAPEHAGADHLKALARISRLLREPSTIEKLRGSRDSAVIYSVLTEKATASHAA